MEEAQNKIKEALGIRGMKQVELAEKTGLSEQKISSWIHQRWQPKQVPLHTMAKVLDVSELWLAGYDVPMNRPIAQKEMDQLADSISFIRENKRYTNIVNKLVLLDEAQLDLVENLINQLSRD